MPPTNSIFGDGHHQPSIDAENADDLQVLSDDDDSELFIPELGLHNADTNMLDNHEDQPEPGGDSMSVQEDTDASSDVEFLSAVARTRRFASSSSVGDCNEIQVKLEPDGDKQDEGNDDLELLGEQPKIKEEPQEEAFQWVDIGDEVIELSDSDEENTNTQTLPTAGRSILQRSNVGHRRTSDNPDKFKALARLFANRALEGRRHIGGAGHIFTAPQANANKQRGQDSTNDSDTWMYSAPLENDDSSSNFAKIKRLYKAKRKAKKTSLEDDIAFKKAIAAEKARLKRIEAKLRQSQLRIDSDDEEAEESDDGTFIPAPKRPNPEVAGTNDQEGAVANGTSAPKHRKVQKSSSKRTRAELQKEEWANLMAGWEERAWLVTEEDADEDTHDKSVARKVKKTTKKANKKSTKKISKGRRKDKESNAKYTDDLLSGHAPGRQRRKKSSRMMANLRTADICDAANSNLGKAAVPVLTGKRKNQAMANLIATIPLDESKRKQAVTDKNKVLRATTSLGNCKVYRKGDRIGDEIDEDAAPFLQDGQGWELKGMTSILYHHQVLGAGTMKDRELGATEPFGGILADSMGFGKTVMVIATIIANPPGLDENHRSTLIICSPALIDQWDNEISKHTDNSVFANVIKHFGITKLSKKGASGRRCIWNIENADIVLSTYYEVVKSYPKCHISQDIKDEDDQFKWWQKEWDDKRDMLHRAHFYRVVLDEAHAMKNHRSYTSIACRALMAKHKWALSGTPIHNSIEELYPYFKLLRIPYTNSFGVFRENFCKAGSNAYNQRLHSVLDDVMIRRTYVDTLFGLPIVQLPENHMNTITLEFNKVERSIYEIFKHRFRKAIQRAKQQGDLEKQVRLILIMFQRLRQLTSHVLMLQESMERLFEVEDIELLWKSTESEVMTGNGNANDMKKALREMIAHKNDMPGSNETPADEEPNTAQGIAPDTEQGNEGPLNFKFRKFVRMLRKSKEWGNLRARSICSKCGDPADDPWVTSCLHLYCSECLRAMSNESASNGQEHTACLQCGEVFTRSERCQGLKELEADEVQSTRQKAADAGQKGMEDGKERRPHRIAKDNMKWCELGDQVLPSTKTAAVQVQIEEWLRDFPQIKIIVFSQYHLSMLVIGQLFKVKGWKYCTYHGQMTHKARSEAVEKFGDEPELRIMIASLKCGGIGLNLTMATRVICIDLWFNSAIEQQAFCRVFRIGQTQETYLTRFVIKDTVDENLVKMQERKNKVIGAAMDDRTVLTKLTPGELIELFGEEECSDGRVKPFIYAEEHPELAHLMPDLENGDDDLLTWQP